MDRIPKEANKGRKLGERFPLFLKGAAANLKVYKRSLLFFMLDEKKVEWRGILKVFFEIHRWFSRSSCLWEQ